MKDKELEKMTKKRKQENGKHLQSIGTIIE